MWTWRGLSNKGASTPASTVAKVEPPAPVIPPPAPAPVAAVTDHPSSAAGSFGVPFFGCADIHTPHFGVSHTPLEEDAPEEE